MTTTKYQTRGFKTASPQTNGWRHGDGYVHSLHPVYGWTDCTCGVAGVCVERQDFDKLVVGAGGQQLTTVAPGHAVDGALVVLVPPEADHRLLDPARLTAHTHAHAHTIIIDVSKYKLWLKSCIIHPTIIGGISVCMSFDLLVKRSSDRLHTWWVYCWGLKEVQCRVFWMSSS